MSFCSGFFDFKKVKVSDPSFSEKVDESDTYSFNPAGQIILAEGYAKIDWKETLEAHQIKVDVPGLKKEEVSVVVLEGWVVQICGEWRKEKDKKKEKWHCKERSSGKFLRRFRLPENAKMEEVKATMEDGVLTVMVPKGEKKKKPEFKSIEITA